MDAFQGSVVFIRYTPGYYEPDTIEEVTTDISAVLIAAHGIEHSDTAWNNFLFFVALCSTIGFVLLAIVERFIHNE